MGLDTALGAMAAIPQGIGKADLQFGIVVRDLEAGMKEWGTLLGLGPWITINKFPGYTFIHRGKPVDVQITVAFAYWGDIQIELIHQDNNADSPYKEFLDAGRQGLQHFGVFVHDYAAARKAIDAAGLKVVYEIKTPHPNDTIYFESSPTVGPMIELVELHEARIKAFGAIKKAGLNWDGARPLRHYSAFDDLIAEQEGRR